MIQTNTYLGQRLIFCIVAYVMKLRMFHVKHFENVIKGRTWTRKGLQLSIQMWTYDKSFARLGGFDVSVLFLLCVGQRDDFVAAIDDNLFHSVVAGGAVGGDVGSFVF